MTYFRHADGVSGWWPTYQMQPLPAQYSSLVLYNINGYYDRMKALLQHTADEKFMDVANMELCAFMDGPEQILTYIENYRRQWTQTKE